MRNEVMRNEVWIVADCKTYGGIESHLLQLMLGLKALKISVRLVLVAEYSPPSPLVEKVKRHQLEYSYISQLASGNIGLQGLRYAVTKYQPILLHSHGYKASILCKLTRLLTGLPQISTYHAGETPKGKVWIYDFIDRFSTFLSSRSFAVSKPIQDKLWGKSIRFNNFVSCVDLEVGNTNRIAFVGRLSEEKAPERFLALANQFPSQEFDCFGAGPLLDKLKSLKPSNLSLHGHVSDPERIWNKTKIVVICSKFEGLPMVALEAMSKKCIVVCTAVGDLPSLIENGENGFIGNSKALPQLLNQALELNEEELKTLQNKAFNTVFKHYSPHVIVPKVVQQYQKAIGQGDSQFENL
ncbi:glycosyltransferase family 4 protein [Vibrio sonorensis]|uniref:glycosyltransferase family 4 protein n=1 Tax=Vibrio sonorensis TaxID=1004316 RepID=UPI0008D8E8BC|nr:glycosyltransferase family 4 protein [Vibrio sonorensis]